MTITVIGQICTARGMVMQRNAITDEVIPFDLPAVGYLRHQPARMPLVGAHDPQWVLGAVGHLERSKADGLLMVGTVVHDDWGEMLDEDGPFYLSPAVRVRPVGRLRYGLGQISSVSLVRRPANVNTRPVRWSRGDLAARTAGAPHGLPVSWHQTWERAAERMSRAKYHRSERMEIHDLDELDIVDELLTDPSEIRRLSLLARAEAELAGAEARLAAATATDDVDRRYRHAYPNCDLHRVGA